MSESAVGLDFRFQIRNHIEETLIEPPIGGDGFLDRNIGDVQTLEHRDPAPFLVVHHVDRVQSVPLPKHSIEGRRNAATLRMPQVH